jgi:hypothetical protein
MGSKYRWFDFADSRNMQGDDAKVERLGQRQGIVGESSPLPRKPAASPKSNKSNTVQGENRTHTSGEILRAKENLSGSGSKKCEKGKSCNATCIFRGDDCISLLSPDLQGALADVRDMLMERVASGKMTQEEAEGYFKRLAQDKSKKKDGDDEEDEDTGDEEAGFPKARIKEFRNAVESLRAKNTKNGVLDSETYQKQLDNVVELAVAASFTDREKKIPISPDEAEAIQKRYKQLEAYDKLSKEVESRKKEGNPMSPEELGEKLRPLAEARRKPVSEEEVALFIAMLPESERKYLQKAGALDKKETAGRFSEDSKSDSLPENYGPLKDQGSTYGNNRLKMLARIYLEEDGRDFASGLRVPITHCDLEHTVAEETAGKAAEQGLNYSFMKTGLNVGRGNTPHLAWWAARSKEHGYKFDENDNLLPESRAKVQANFDKVMRQIEFKNRVEMEAARAKNADMLRELYKQAQGEEDSDLKKKLFTKIIAYNLGTSETVGGGVQSHGRGDKRWYWLGKDTNQGDKVSSRMIEKLISLYEAGDTEGIAKFRSILGQASEKVKAEVKQRVTPDAADIDPSSGELFVRVKGERGKQVRDIVTEVRDQVLDEILSI